MKICNIYRTSNEFCGLGLSTNMILIFVFIIPCFWCLSLFAVDSTAVIIYAEGSVKLINRNVTVERGTWIEHGDKIVTGKDGLAVVQFIRNARIIRIRPHSIFSLNPKPCERSIIRSICKEIIAIYLKVTKKETYNKISTPTSIAAVK